MFLYFVVYLLAYIIFEKIKKHLNTAAIYTVKNENNCLYILSEIKLVLPIRYMFWQ